TTPDRQVKRPFTVKSPEPPSVQPLRSRVPVVAAALKLAVPPKFIRVVATLYVSAKVTVPNSNATAPVPEATEPALKSMGGPSPSNWRVAGAAMVHGPVLVTPLRTTSVPICRSTVPVLLNGTPMVAAPSALVPPVFLKRPLLLNAQGRSA